jgi:hypothetical protein
MQPAPQVMNIPIYDEAVSVCGTYGNGFLSVRPKIQDLQKEIITAWD